jgi:hypothetical protein
MPRVKAAKAVRQTMAQMRRSRPGHRFQDYHDKAKRSDNKPNPLRRLIRIAAALVMTAIGIFLVVVPGPAIPFFFVAGALLATESRIVAKAMDWIELRLRAAYGWGHKYWRRLPMSARIALMVMMSAFSLAGAYFSYRLLSS